MNRISLCVVALLFAASLSEFVPVPDYNLSQIEGTWSIQSIYDTTGNVWALYYCHEFYFNVINESYVNLTVSSFDGYSGTPLIQNAALYPDPENPAILYQDTTQRFAPLLVLNVSSIPYWANNYSDVTIFAFNYTRGGDDQPRYIILGGSKWYDTAYDIRPLLKTYNFPVINNKNFWFINTACDTHFGWSPLKNFNATTLLNKTWNLIAVYDPAESDLVPWYQGQGGIYDWEQAYCAQVTFQPGAEYDLLMNLSLKSLYQGGLQRSWQILPYPTQNSFLMGFINENTLLYVSYSDLTGNIILTAGTTTSFFLSSSITSLDLVWKGIFEVVLKNIDSKADANYIYSIDCTSC